MFCTKCGKELNPSDRFCAYCGSETRQNEPQMYRYDDVVFNPPFRIEAERKTAEILKEREEFRGFSEAGVDAPAEKKTRERINFDWNLDGLPTAEQKKTEEVNFDWGEVLEKRNLSREDRVEKFEFEPLGPTGRTGLDESYSEPHLNIDKGEKAERILGSLFGAGMAKEILRNEIPEPIVEQININEEPAEEDSIISLEDLERELFGNEESPSNFGTATVQYRPLVSAEIDSSEELDSFFGDENKLASRDSDAGNLDPSVTTIFTPVDNKFSKLFSMPNDKKTQAVGEDYSAPLFEDILKDISELKDIDEPTTEAKPVGTTTEAMPVGIVTEADLQDDKPFGSDTYMDVYASTKEDVELVEELSEIESEKPSEETESVMEETQESANLYDELFKEPELSPEERANQKFYTFHRNNDAFKELLRREKERLEKMGAEYVPQNAFAENEAKKQSTKTKLTYVSAALPAETTNVDATGMEHIVISGPGAPKNIPNEGDTGYPPLSESKENGGFKYADVFPGTYSGNTFTDAGISISEEKLTQKTEKAQQLKEFFEEIDNEEPEKGNGFAKFLLAVLIIAMLALGTGYVAKKFFPESIVAEYTDVAIEKGTELIDKISGNEEPAEPLNTDDNVEATANTNAVYLSNIVSEKSTKLKTVGEVHYALDDSLRFSTLSTFAFPEVQSLPEFEDGEWQLLADGDFISYGEGLISADIDYYDSWLSSNENSELLGINALEICDVKMEDDTGYVLNRISFATADGTEKSKVQTIKFKINEEKIVIEEIKDETEEEN